MIQVVMSSEKAHSSKRDRVLLALASGTAHAEEALAEAKQELQGPRT